MNELYREQHPLLCDDFSDDELSTQNCSPRSNKRLRSIVYSGYKKYQMRGAAAIFKTWPENWWSTLKYWWIGLGMITIIVLIVYNSVYAFSILPMAYTKTLKSEVPYSNVENLLTEQISDVYMHVFAKSEDAIVLKDFLPYVKIISKRYPNFNFNFIIVINETFNESEELNDETKNILALNSLWTDVSYNNNHRIVDNNLVVSYISINNYLSNPALQKISTRFSNDFIEFLIRVLSIWEKGGIVFNPVILTPRSPKGSYMDGIHKLLNHYVALRYKKDKKIKEDTRQSIELHKPKKRLDNIRDIINALEEDERLYNVSQHNLAETEDKIYSVTVDTDDNVESFKNENASNLKSIQQTSHIDNVRESSVDVQEKNNSFHDIEEQKYDLDTHKMHASANNSRNSTQSSLQHSFLEFLFPKVGDLDSFHKKGRAVRSHNILNKRGIYPTISKNNKQDSYSDNTEDKGLLDTEENSQLTIDLNGNIVASNTPCHAFVGNLLKNAAHHSEEETLTEFIIAELTVFCNGVLSSCKGIDVLLL